MNLVHRKENDIDIVRLPERLMMADAPDARTALREIIEGGSGKLLLDLSHTTFMDTSGLAVLVSSLKAARKKDGDVYLANMGPTLRAVFELTRLHTVFQIFDDAASAVRSVQ